MQQNTIMSFKNIEEENIRSKKNIYAKGISLIEKDV